MAAAPTSVPLAGRKVLQGLRAGCSSQLPLGFELFTAQQRWGEQDCPCPGDSCVTPSQGGNNNSNNNNDNNEVSSKRRDLKPKIQVWELLSPSSLAPNEAKTHPGAEIRFKVQPTRVGDTHSPGVTRTGHLCVTTEPQSPGGARRGSSRQGWPGGCLVTGAR